VLREAKQKPSRRLTAYVSLNELQGILTTMELLRYPKAKVELRSTETSLPTLSDLGATIMEPVIAALSMAIIVRDCGAACLAFCNYLRNDHCAGSALQAELFSKATKQNEIGNELRRKTMITLRTKPSNSH